MLEQLLRFSPLAWGCDLFAGVVLRARGVRVRPPGPAARVGWGWSRVPLGHVQRYRGPVRWYRGPVRCGACPADSCCGSQARCCEQALLSAGFLRGHLSPSASELFVRGPGRAPGSYRSHRFFVTVNEQPQAEMVKLVGQVFSGLVEIFW